MSRWLLMVGLGIIFGVRYTYIKQLEKRYEVGQKVRVVATYMGNQRITLSGIEIKLPADIKLDYGDKIELIGKLEEKVLGDNKVVLSLSYRTAKKIDEGFILGRYIFIIRQKMLQREHDDKDRRVIWISVTPKGRQVVSHIRQQKCRSVKAIFGHLTQEERRLYLAILLKVKSRLSEG